MIEPTILAEPARARARPRDEAGTYRVTLTHDYWPEEDRRVPAGTELSLPVDEAMRLVQDDKAKPVMRAA